jgi:hypothetical protein
MEARGGTGRWILFLGLTFFVALVAAVAILTLYQASPQAPGAGEPSAPIALPADLTGGVSARQAYPSAANVAQSWQADGQLAIVSAHWQPRRGRWSAEVAWMFQFYSPATHRLAVVIVDGGRALLLREALSPYSVPTFGEGDWQVDSPAALDAWWNDGGAHFLSTYSEVDLMAQLRVLDREDNRLAWTVTGVAGNQVKKVVVDGQTGERVQN